MKTVVYTKTFCPACDRLKEYLDRNNIPYEVKNTQEKPEHKQAVIDMGIQAVPVLVVENTDGERETMIGYDPEKLAEIYGI